MSARLILAWWDFWIGIYWDRRRRELFILPVPMVGIAIGFGRKDWV